MAVRLQLENGKIKEYSTWYYHAQPEYSGPFRCYTKCGIQTEECPVNGGACDHLDCALEAVKRDVKAFTFVGAFSIPIIFIAGYYEIRNLQKSVSGAIDFLIFCVLFGMPTALLSLKPWIELREFKNHGTIGGLKARKL